MAKFVPVLTIDGPSGSGKGTIARLVAKEFGWHFLDSGAIYRLLALYALQQNCAVDDVLKLEKLALELPVRFAGAEIFLDGNEVAVKIRAQEVSDMASKVASIPVVRSALMARQKAFAELPGLVADGRDMGTVVFTDAFLKIYLDASAQERAKRRFLQLKDSGYNVNLQDLAVEIEQRDERDRTRAVAPLKPAEEAIIIDSSRKSITEVFDMIVDLAKQRLSNF